MTSGVDPSGRDRRVTASSFRWPVLVVVLLTFASGYADGYTLSRFDVFIANQSGNIVRAGMGMFGEYAQWRLALLSILGFAIGAVLSWSLDGPARRFGWTLVRARLLLATVLLGCWWVILLVGGPDTSTGLAAAGLGGMALGVLASAMTHLADLPVQTTFQTGTVLNSAQGLVRWLTGDPDSSGAGRRLALLGALMVVTYGLGGAAGAFADRIGPTAVLVCLLLPASALLLTRTASVTRS